MLIIRAYKKTFWQRVKQFILLPFKKIAGRIVQSLLNWRAKLQIGSLRVAIGEADKDKDKTGRKNMVVFNTVSGKYEPIQKKVLKRIADKDKNKSNKAMTDGRKRAMKQQKRKKRILDHDRAKQIEEKSLYVTK
jgi:hypothetical protein